MMFADAVGAALVLLPIAAYGRMILTGRLWLSARNASAALVGGLVAAFVVFAQPFVPTSEAIRTLGEGTCFGWVLAGAALAHEISQGVFGEVGGRADAQIAAARADRGPR